MEGCYDVCSRHLQTVRSVSVLINAKKIDKKSHKTEYY